MTQQTEHDFLITGTHEAKPTGKPIPQRCTCTC
jgi:hypothetical protein